MCRSPPIGGNLLNCPARFGQCRRKATDTGPRREGAQPVADQSSNEDARIVEERSLRIGMVGNLALGLAGVTASVLSGSQALLVDGLFSLVGLVASAVAIGVTRRAAQGPDRVRPLGYAMDEAIFTTFRAFVLVGLVLFSGAAALVKIVKYLGGTVPAPISFGPVGIYMVVVLSISGVLWLVHRRAWTRTGRQSDVLKLEASAVAFDALMTVAAGLGFLLVYLLRDGPLSVLAPVGDSIIVLVLCGLAAWSYFSDFRRGLGELAGVTADPALVFQAGRILRGVLSADEGRLVDFSVLKSGRLLTVIAYYDPPRPIGAAEVDALTLRLGAALSGQMGNVEVVVVISEHGRRLPGAGAAAN